LGLPSVNQAAILVQNASQAIQWLVASLGIKDAFMMLTVPRRDAQAPFRSARSAALFALAALTSLPSVEARAQDTSPWQKTTHAAVRLLAGSRSGPVLLGGIAIQLDPGWKTYWRTSGDSGVPPRFDFSRSDNVEAVTVLWPAPTRFDDGAGGTSLGYHNQVVLPLRIVPKSTEKPVTLRAEINYAVCEKLCIPVEANAELTFTSVASTEDNVLFAALDTVPKPASVGDPNPLTIRDVKREGKSSVLVDVVSPDAKPVNLFVEGPTPDWSLPVPKLLEHGPNGIKRFSFELDGVPPGTNPQGAALKLTLVGGDRAFEFNINLE
jgi:DsbC/DsbD-like thiol-disulfide interchange protein